MDPFVLGARSQIQTMVTMMVMTTMMSIINTLVTVLTKGLKSVLQSINNRISTVKKQPDQLRVVTITCNEILTSAGTYRQWNVDAQHVVSAMYDFMTNNGVHGGDNELQVMVDPTIMENKFRGYKLQIVPRGRVVYGSFIIETINELIAKTDEKSKSVASRNQSIKVSSLLPVSDILEFIQKCYTEWVDRYYPKVVSTKEPPLYMYEQMPGDKISFRRYELRGGAGFDDLFYPQKDELLRNIDNLRGKLDRESLKILMHGPPGGGKTSTIRATAFRERRHIVTINLSCLKTDADLMSVLHDLTICYKTGDNIEYDRVPLERRIIVLEDIDADGVVTHRRNTAEERAKFIASRTKKQSSEDEPGASGDMYQLYREWYNSSGLTLKGLLNAFDGIVSLVGPIVFITTNHPQKLDPALIRGGRINMRLMLTYMTSEDALRLIGRYFGETSTIKIPPGDIPPCEVESFCKTSRSADVVVAKMAEYIQSR